MNYGYEGDKRFEPLTPWTYFWLTILYAIPIVGFVFLIVNSFRSGNINRRSFTRSYFCALLLVVIVCAIVLLIGGAAGLTSLLN